MLTILHDEHMVCHHTQSTLASVPVRIAKRLTSVRQGGHRQIFLPRSWVWNGRRSSKAKVGQTEVDDDLRMIVFVLKDFFVKIRTRIL